MPHRSALVADGLPVAQSPMEGLRGPHTASSAEGAGCPTLADPGSPTTGLRASTVSRSIKTVKCSIQFSTLSDGTATVSDMFHPWRALRRLTHVNLHWREMDGILGQTDGATVIYMNPDQSQAQRRCTLAHELAHIELGHICGETPKDEAASRELAARRMIPIETLMDALRWADNLEEVADELWVDHQTLIDRLDTLTDDERQALVDLHHSIEQGA